MNLSSIARARAARPGGFGRVVCPRPIRRQKKRRSMRCGCTRTHRGPTRRAGNLSLGTRSRATRYHWDSGPGGAVRCDGLWSRAAYRSRSRAVLPRVASVRLGLSRAGYNFNPTVRMCGCLSRCSWERLARSRLHVTWISVEGWRLIATNDDFKICAAHAPVKSYMSPCQEPALHPRPRHQPTVDHGPLTGSSALRVQPRGAHADTCGCGLCPTRSTDD
jgi:hypothetical protein